MEITIDIASVKVMRSFDYCHFEVCLSSTAPQEIIESGSSASITPQEVDELRKTAARLADKAVAQYRVAKVNAQRLLNEKCQRNFIDSQMKCIEGTPEVDRTVNEQATLKAYKDVLWEANRAYDYEDDWEDDSEQ